MKNILGYIIAGIVLFFILSIVLVFLKVTVKILFYLFIGAIILSAIAYLYNKVIKK